MNLEAAAIVLIIAATVGGAIGARLGGADAWRGGLAALGGTVALVGIAATLAGGSAVWAWVGALVVTGLIGGALKLSGQQNIQTAIGGFLLAIIASLISSHS